MSELERTRSEVGRAIAPPYLLVMSLKDAENLLGLNYDYLKSACRRYPYSTPKLDRFKPRRGSTYTIFKWNNAAQEYEELEG